MKLIISDLDNSIIKNNIISPKDVISIKNWIKIGNEFTIATGRPLCRIRDYIKEFDLNFPVIINNGMAIYEKNHGIELLDKFNDYKFLSIIEESGILKNLIVFSLTDVCLVNADDNLISKINSWSSNYKLLKNTSELLKFTILSFALYYPTEELLNFIKIFSTDYSINYHLPKYIDILPKNANKGNALKRILNSYNFESIYVIGDSLGDLSMKFGSINFVAVENSEYEVKKQSDIIISSCENDPVSNLIKIISTENKE